MLERDLGQFPTSVSPDGRFVALWERNPDTGDDIHILSLDGDRATIPFLTTPASERDELFYISGTTMMAVSVTFEPTFEAGTPQPLFEGSFDQWYDVSPDGSFVMLTKPSAELDEIYVIVNWFSELQARVPTGQ